MTLDEAIKHCEEVVKECERHIYRYPDQLAYKEKFYDAEKCAEEHRQLAEWLQELKELRENKGKIIEAVYVVTTILVNMKATNIIAQCFLCMLIQMIFAVMQKGEKMSDSINRQAAMSL